MSSEDFKIFLEDLYVFLNDLENAILSLKGQIDKLTGYKETHLIEAPGPCDPQNAALRWLEGKLHVVKEKHPESEWSFLKSPDGKIMGLKVRVPSPEVLADYESLAKWAFEKASQRPTEK
jgi:hypothetical protein